MKTLGFINLDIMDILGIHERQLRAHGGQAGLRNRGGLESAIAQPMATFGGEDLYPDIFAKASALIYFIAENQVFVDGNKRTALVSGLTFLRVNGFPVPPNEFQFYSIMIAIAKKEATREDLEDLLRSFAESQA